MASRLVHGALLSRLAAFYPATVNIQQYTATRDSYGAEIKTWASVSGLTNIPCAISMLQGGREIQRADSTIAIASHRIALAGHYDEITPKMRATPDGGATLFDILAVSHDSQSQTTYLDCRIVS